MQYVRNVKLRNRIFFEADVTISERKSLLGTNLYKNMYFTPWTSHIFFAIQDDAHIRL